MKNGCVGMVTKIQRCFVRSSKSPDATNHADRSCLRSARTMTGVDGYYRDRVYILMGRAGYYATLNCGTQTHFTYAEKKEPCNNYDK
ncbi:hypothetical protein CEXT_503581 [Caerostris extrusa]|uniref:Uncharacterized protein n=1 Tax=Caerostris extrusa TaxID=172846 RepID=A0AAV4VRX1_CAEEX|nr:hypothetical protein CEXT_503581 [Caerostris extrusa]